MIHLSVFRTGKGYSPKDEYKIFDNETKTFETLRDAKEYLKETYGNCKRDFIYRDKTDGTTIKVGYIYSFNNCDWSHSPLEKWRQKDWVEICEVIYKHIEL